MYEVCLVADAYRGVGGAYRPYIGHTQCCTYMVLACVGRSVRHIGHTQCYTYIHSLDVSALVSDVGRSVR